MNSSHLLSEIEIHFSCKNLKSKDLFSKSDPFIVLYSINKKTNIQYEIGRTETIINSSNPIFTKSFKMEYYFEEIQYLKIEVYDRDKHTESLSSHDFLGQVECTLGKIVGSKGQKIILNLLSNPNSLIFNDNNGSICIQAEEVNKCNDYFIYQLCGEKLDNKDGIFGKSDPFIEIYRGNEDNSYTKVWTSDVIMNNLYPKWKEANISLQTICNGDMNRTLKFVCMDWEKDGSHQFIGSFLTSVYELINGKNKFDLINDKKKEKKGKKYQNSGKIYFSRAEMIKQYSFFEYLSGGCEINLIAAIDYTASNGTPSNPNSLHYLHPQIMNQYQHAIYSTGSILEQYDYDKKFCVYGFGGQLNGLVNHCFPLNFNYNNPEINGVEEILRVYASSFNFVTLSGPTLFAPVINQAARMCIFDPIHPKYYVLLIITDGVIMDMPATIDAIISASHLPLSIVIVGVGNADFTAMDALDGDSHVLQSANGQTAIRDIVQFVEFCRYANDPFFLTKEVLKEIPIQLTQFMKIRKIVPNNIINNINNQNPLLQQLNQNDTSTNNIAIHFDDSVHITGIAYPTAPVH